MATRTTLNISLPLELGEFIQQRIASGRYASASEVVRAALRLLEECEGRQVPAAVAQRHRAKAEKTRLLAPGASADG
jgi:antitoxin ParD1/3/4